MQSKQIVSSHNYQDITPDDCEGKSQLNIEQIDVYVSVF